MTAKQIRNDKERCYYNTVLSIRPIARLWMIESTLKTPENKKLYLKTLWRCHNGQMSLTQAASERVVPVIIIKYLLRQYF